ncbi:hypothetical protein IE81DRAFT_104555 [Ceraceosorus guamensis]|uniref:Uncharacterized protein n=1 Tax=Ceraceosorus guamensis TaxID=1522189 RepID=A0A316W0S4_9BASI|nr:hypothetical protein IE81DRAFT_104555 [Ceraceosorus guamensis]PWN43104.1 hypothetical protein IE81DRAFT_104555 [Ceraceosorus guamensis]
MRSTARRRLCMLCLPDFDYHRAIRSHCVLPIRDCFLKRTTQDCTDARWRLIPGQSFCFGRSCYIIQLAGSTTTAMHDAATMAPATSMMHRPSSSHSPFICAWAPPDAADGIAGRARERCCWQDRESAYAHIYTSANAVPNLSHLKHEAAARPRHTYACTVYQQR